MKSCARPRETEAAQHSPNWAATGDRDAAVSAAPWASLFTVTYDSGECGALDLLSSRWQLSQSHTEPVKLLNGQSIEELSPPCAPTLGRGG